MAKYRIAWMPGDGVGVDVMEAAQTVLEKIKLDAEFIYADIGWEFWKSEGNALPDRTIDILRNCDCGLFGAITSKPKEEANLELNPELRDKGYVYTSPIVRLRQLFDLYTNLRPCKAYPGNPLNYREGIDLVVFRENTQGLYSGIEFYPLANDLREKIAAHNKNMHRFDDVPGEDIAITLRVITREGAARIVRKAFEYAKEFNYPTVTLVEKPNVLRETSGLMTRVARKIAEEYPGIELWETNIDAQMMWLLKNPENYGVMVTSNLFGDVVSDLSAQLVGGLGFASSGNIGDPTAMLLASKLMLDWLGEKESANRIENAVRAVILEGKVRTYDMGGSDSTLDMGRAIAEHL
jgi:isocitrate/isopropylmalate dehydrogenase